jgi:hypothetical protein
VVGTTDGTTASGVLRISWCGWRLRQRVAGLKIQSPSGGEGSTPSSGISVQTDANPCIERQTDAASPNHVGACGVVSWSLNPVCSGRFGATWCSPLRSKREPYGTILGTSRHLSAPLWAPFDVARRARRGVPFRLPRSAMNGRARRSRQASVRSSGGILGQPRNAWVDEAVAVISAGAESQDTGSHDGGQLGETLVRRQRERIIEGSRGTSALGAAHGNLRLATGTISGVIRPRWRCPRRRKHSWR